jgi:hypothetical protein
MLPQRFDTLFSQPACATMNRKAEMLVWPASRDHA